MNKYIAVGHWAGSTNISSIVGSNDTMKDFRHDCKANGFIAYIVMKEDKFNNIKDDRDLIYETVKKSTSNYRKWNIVTEYLTECSYIVEEKLSI